MSRSFLRIALVFLLIGSEPGWAATGDKLYVQNSVANVRTGPGTNHDVLMQLNKGHELIEFSRQGAWVNVGITRTRGKDGWIHSSLVDFAFPGGGTTAPKDPRFNTFVRDVEKLNARVRSVVGFSFFTRVENLGDGIVQATAHNRWFEAPVADRQDNLNTLFELWSAHEASGQPIAVYIVDSRGNVVMKKAR